MQETERKLGKYVKQFLFFIIEAEDPTSATQIAFRAKNYLYLKLVDWLTLFVGILGLVSFAINLPILFNFILTPSQTKALKIRAKYVGRNISA